MRTYIVGRSRYADIILADTSVGRRHAELVVTATGRHHLTDCASGAGTWRRVTDAGGRDSWETIRQAFVDADAPLRLGDHLCTTRDLLGQVEGEDGGDGSGTGSGEGGGRWRSGLAGSGGSERERLRGRVERDPVTGEIIRKRI